MALLAALALLAPDGSGGGFSGTIPIDARVGDVIAIITGTSPPIGTPAPSFTTSPSISPDSGTAEPLAPVFTVQPSISPTSGAAE